MMLVTRRFLLSLSILLVMFMAWKSVESADDIPEKMREELDRGKTQLEGEFKAAQEKLLSSFDKKISNSRSAPKLSGEEKQQLIANIEAEKALFERLGHIPFTPVMRTDAIEYLNRVQKAEIALTKIYDRAIDSQTKQKKDEAARSLIEEKNQAIEPKRVAKWEFIPSPKPNIQSLWSNGSAGGKDRTHFWTLDHRHLVIKWKNKDAPGGFNIDTCVISADGKHLDGKNNSDYKFTAKRIVTD